jgi:adenine-specific DNA methylase
LAKGSEHAMSEGRRLIEVDFPIGPVSRDSVREKSIRHGHISTLHIWWARRPLAASRATALAALLPDPGDEAERRRLLELVQEIAPWEIVKDGDSPLIQEARDLIRRANGGRAPKVLDCFAGGGNISLEALRLGCEAYALDYNPVAVLLLKCVLEYPQRFGRPELRREWTPQGLAVERQVSPLVEAVERWGRWVLKEARKELAAYYPPDPDGAIPVGYLWARTLPCQNPACGIEIPLLRQTWLANKKDRKVALRLVPDTATRTVQFTVVEGKDIDFDPSEGTVIGAKVRCPLCRGTIDAETTRQLFRKGKAGERMVAVILQKSGQVGKRYRVAAGADQAAFDAASAALEEKRRLLWEAWGLDPVPDEPLPPPGTLGFRVQRYGLTTWGDLFNARQKLALITFAEKVREAHQRMVEDGMDSEFAKALTVGLAIIFDRLVDKNANLVTYNVSAEKIEHVFGRQALPMVWDFVELNPFSDVGWSKMQEWVLASLKHLSGIQSESYGCPVTQGTATTLPWQDATFDAVLTDPPYYDNVPYSDLSDFFYVWLKRTLGDLYPDLFSTPLTPKSHELVADASRARGMERAKSRFEAMLRQAFREIHRVLKPEGVAVIVFAHQSTSAWETVIQALLEAGLYMTASWPIHTEKAGRLRAQESAALASSIYMVCRKRTTNAVGAYAQVRREVEERVRDRLQHFWNEGIRGADFFMSAIGPAVEVFGRYARVERLSGEQVTVPELLQHVREVVARFALERILRDGAQAGGVDAPTRFYLLYRWTYNHASVPFDEARKLAQAVGVELASLWGNHGLVVRDKEYVRVPAPHERFKDGRNSEPSRLGNMIDALHAACTLWSKNAQKALEELLSTTYGSNETFWQVAQAIAEVLPENDRERQVLQGLLYRRRTHQQARLL